MHYITEFGFCSVKQTTVEEFEFECSRCGKNLKSSIPVVNATTHPRSAGRNFVALSFLVNRQYFTTKFGAIAEYKAQLVVLDSSATVVPQWNGSLGKRKINCCYRSLQFLYR